MYNKNINYFLLGVFVVSVSTAVASVSTFMFLSVALFIYFILIVGFHFKKKKDAKLPLLRFKNTRAQRELAKIKRKRLKQAEKKHQLINDQFTYIQNVWSLSKEQQKTFVSFMDKRAYSDLYAKMTASLLPQLIKMIDLCIEKNKRACKRDVTKRINELVTIMKDEIKRKNNKKVEDFETITHVYDHLIDELK